MRYYPDLTKEYDAQEWKNLNGKDWMLELLKKNPDYCSWGNGEDYMWTDKKSGWNSEQEIDSVTELFNLDDLNELVNFYFYVEKKSHQCEICEGTSLNPETKKISDDWYDFAQTGRKWNHNISDIEVKALMESNRLHDFKPRDIYYDSKQESWINIETKLKVEVPQYPSAEEVNKWSRKGIGHDAINMWIAVEARATHLGVYGHCEHCVEGYIYDEEEGHIGLQMWIIHPRKGASRGVGLTNINENEVPIILDYLKLAATRNAKRFSKL